MAIRYPTRCQIIDVDNLDYKVGRYTAKTPGGSHAHVGKQGLAEKMGEIDVRITLDDGTILMGNECWWIPLGLSQSQRCAIMRSVRLCTGLR